MPFPTTEEVAQALATYLAHSDLWPAEPERRQVARHVARAYGSPWSVRRRMASPGGSAAFIVVREDDEVYSNPVQDRAKSVAAALNALEELEDASQVIEPGPEKRARYGRELEPGVVIVWPADDSRAQSPAGNWSDCAALSASTVVRRRRHECGLVACGIAAHC